MTTPPALHWSVLSGPEAEHGIADDYERWAYSLGQGNERRRMLVEISGALLFPARIDLRDHPQTTRAIASRGRSEVEAISRWWDPPTKSVFTVSEHPRRLGGKP